MRRAFRVSLKAALALLILVVVVVAAGLIFIHTNTGREVVRDKLEAQLADTFTGEVRIGKLEGSPFGTYVAREVVIDGPDGEPAIEIGKLSLHLQLGGLVGRHAVLSNLTAEDVSVKAKRMADGSLSLAHLIKPGPDSAWTVSIKELVIKRGKFELAGDKPIAIDDLEITGDLEMAGETIKANASVSATWRERNLPVRAVLSLDKTGELITIPTVVAHAGDATFHGANLRITESGFGGTGVLRATQAAVAAIAPEIELPGDVELGFEIGAPDSADAPMHVKLAGTLGGDAMSGVLEVWLATRRVAGSLFAPDVQIAKLTGGKIDARGGGSIELDLQLTGAQLPIGRFAADVQGTYRQLPRTSLKVSATSDGQNVRGAVEATNPGIAGKLAGELAFAGERIALTSATLSARSRNLGAAAGRAVPVSGSFTVDLAAHGQLMPRPVLAIAGTIDGKKIVVQPANRGEPSPLRLETFTLEIDGKRIPEKPYGRLALLARDVQGESFAVREVSLRAADRSDGAIQATLRTRMAHDPWLVEADALIRFGEVITIDLQRHLVRAGAGTEWHGTTGRVAIAKDRIEVKDLATTSKDGALAVAATYYRIGRRAGDVMAKVDAKAIAIANVAPELTGTVDAKVDFTRTNGIVHATAEVRATDVSVIAPRPNTVAKVDVLATAPVDPNRKPVTTPRDAKGTPVDGKSQIAATNGTSAPILPAQGDHKPALEADAGSRSVAMQAKTTAGVPAGSDSAGTAAERARRTPGFDATAKLTIDGSRAVVDATLSSGTSRASLAVELAGPAQITDAKAWSRLGRDAIKTATLRANNFEIATALKSLGVIGEYGGTLDGELRLAGTAGGELQLRDLRTPELRGLGPINADLRIAMRGNDLVPSLTARLDRIGAIDATAEITPPARPFDARQWATLGRGAIRHASIKARDLAIDPGRLEQLGLAVNARGRISFEIDVLPARVKLDVFARELRGSPVSDPIDAELHANVGAISTAVTLDFKVRGQSMFEGNATIPVSLDDLIAAPAQLEDLPLSGSGRLHISASRLLGVFGRREITGGELDGSVLVSGTVGKPSVVGTIVGTKIEVPPGRRNRPIKRIERIAIDGVFDDNKLTLIIDGTQVNGRLILAVNADLDALDKATATLSSKNFDLMPLLAFAPGPAGGAAGRLDANLKVRGLDPKTMDLEGTVALRNGRIPLAPNVGTMRRASVELTIKNRVAQITLDGRLGGGSVKAKGSASLDGTGGEIAMTLRKVSPIGVVEPEIDADVKIKIQRQDLTWIADIDVTGGKIVIPDKRGVALAPVGAPTDMVFVTGERITRRPMEKAPPTRPVLIANIKFGRTRVESKEVRGVVHGNLKITTDAKSIGMVGSIEADRGDLDLFGRRYRVEHAAVRFDGGIDPILDIELLYDFPEVTTFTQVRGRLSKPQLVMTSNPGTYSQGQLLGFLLGGEPTGGVPGDARDKATAAGTSFVANQIGGYVKKTLPIDLDVLRYEAATASTSAAVTVGTWLRHGLFLAYRQRLDARPDENNGEGELEYWLSRRVVIEAVVGDRNRDSVDLLWRKRY